jgi:hypothetical protein
MQAGSGLWVSTFEFQVSIPPWRDQVEGARSPGWTWMTLPQSIFLKAIEWAGAREMV